MQALKNIIEAAYEKRDDLRPRHVPNDINHAILETIALLDKGAIRVAEKKQADWHINEWVKKAVLLYFRTQESKVMSGSFTQFFDKVPLK